MVENQVLLNRLNRVKTLVEVVQVAQVVTVGTLRVVIHLQLYSQRRINNILYRYRLEIGFPIIVPLDRASNNIVGIPVISE